MVPAGSYAAHTPGMDGVGRAAVLLSAVVIGLMTLGLAVTVVVGAATYEEPPPMLTPDQLVALADDGMIVLPDEEATRDHADDALTLARRMERVSPEMDLAGLSLARFTQTRGRWQFDLVWVAFREHVLQRCFGPTGACGPGPIYGRDFALFDARTLEMLGSSSV